MKKKMTMDKGRSPLGNGPMKTDSPAKTNYGGRPSVPRGKPKDVSLTGGMAGGNRRTAKAAVGADNGMGANFNGHGAFSRT